MLAIKRGELNCLNCLLASSDGDLDRDGGQSHISGHRVHIWGSIMNQMKRAANIEQPAVESKKKKEKVKH